MPSITPLPPVNARVDIWFDGYDEYYPGRVDRIAGPHEFHVVLDDGTDWDIDTRKHVFKLSEVPAEEEEPEPTTPTEPPVVQQSAKPLSTDIPSPPPRRRSSGRALRKSATPRADDDYQPELPSVSSGVRRSTRVEAAAAAARVIRPRRGVEEAPPPTPPPLDRATRMARRTRMREDDDDEEHEAPVSKKPRKVSEVSEKPKDRPMQKQRELEREKEKERDKEREMEREQEREQEREKEREKEHEKEHEKEREKERQKEKEREQEKEKEQHKEIITRVRDEYGLEGLSTKAVTAIAVDAALQSAKAVLSPLNERLEALVKEVVEIGKIAMRATEAAESRKRAPLPPPAITAAALENFQLDVSEIIGGGEARIKAYSGMSEQEFEALHRVIDAQGKALKEIDRLLYAAQEFGKRAKEASDKGEKNKEKEVVGDNMDVDKVAENAHSAPAAEPEAAVAK